MNFIGFLLGIFVTWEIGGWVVLSAIAGGTLATIPLSIRRSRDIGWIPIFAPILSIAALVSIAAFLSLLLPVSLGIWKALEQTGFGLFWWDLIFAGCIRIWAWWSNSLLDRPTKGAPIEENPLLEPDEKTYSARAGAMKASDALLLRRLLIMPIGYLIFCFGLVPLLWRTPVRELPEGVQIGLVIILWGGAYFGASWLSVRLSERRSHSRNDDGQ